MTVDICEHCGAKARINNNGKIGRFCSRKCASRFSCLIRKATNLQKYGVDNPAKATSVLLKRVETCLSRYGVHHVLQNKEVRQKAAETNLKKYGNEHACRSHEIQQKIKRKWEKYEGGHPWADPTVRLTREDTLLARYGVKHPILYEPIRAQIEQTCFSVFGNINAAKSDIIKEKISATNLTPAVQLKTKQTNLSRYGVEHSNQQQIKEQMVFLLDAEWMKDSVCRLGYVGVASLLQVSIDTVRKYASIHNISSPSKSAFELAVVDFIARNYSGEIKVNQRMLDNKEVDIFIPDLNLAIECNGSYWHSELNGRSREYHLTKTKNANKLGIHLVHIWEHDWADKQHIIRSRLKSFLKKNVTIPARKCKIIVVDPEQSTTFLTDNHIQGNCSASIRIGLSYNNEIVSLMTFSKSRFTTNAEFELLRFANMLDHTVVGAASRLFLHFIKTYSPRSVISYSDKAFNKGTVYKTLGFAKSHESTPAYQYTRDYKLFENRIKYQKHKLKNILSNFDDALSEWDNMKLNGYDRIWDCGTDVWLWHSPN